MPELLYLSELEDVLMEYDFARSKFPMAWVRAMIYLDIYDETDGAYEHLLAFFNLKK